MVKARAVSQLRQFMREQCFVRFTRPLEPGFVRGYVLDVGPKFFLVAAQSDQIRMDGFSCFRIKDVRGLERDPYGAFSEAARKKLGDPKPRKPKVSLTSVEHLLLSARQQFQLVTIHREMVKPGVCWIGKVAEIARGKVFLLEIGPDAKWDDEPTSYRLNEITSVEFGGEYERALFLVGGNPPSQ